MNKQPKKRTISEYRQIAGIDSNKHKKKIEHVETTKTIGNFKWLEIPCKNIKKYQLEDQPEIIYIIKTGFKNKYIVVNEDAYELYLGNVEILTSNEIEIKYNIKI